MMLKFSKIVGLCAVALVLSGCAILPRSGPDDGQINQAAAIKLETEDATLGYDYALVDINKKIKEPDISRHSQSLKLNVPRKKISAIV